MPHLLAPLPYAYAALEPHLDELTLHLHHDKHHQAYVDNLNKALAAPEAAEFANLKIETLMRLVARIPLPLQTAIRNNGGAHFNHTFYWEGLAPAANSGAPAGSLAVALEASFGSFEKFKEAFSAAAMGRFGSGWAWLSVSPAGTLEISSTPYQDNPLMDGLVPNPGTPLLCIDVWEHSYYLKYQNRRADYVKAFWNIVNWAKVEERFDQAQKA